MSGASSWDDPDRWTAETSGGRAPALEIRRIVLVAADGARHEPEGERISIGSHSQNDIVVADDAASRFHAEIVIDARGPRVRDLGSKNGTFVDGVRVEGAWLRHASRVRFGRTELRVEATSRTTAIALSAADRFGDLWGASVAMRALFARMERAAPVDATVLLEGETGTGKEEAAAALHDASRRAERPFIALDCGALPRTLLESELFGHERGAFTGATGTRAGAFEAAHGGTLFLDEIGELPLEVQPVLLRALETREIRRLGSNATRQVDVRIIAATNRDLREEVGAGRFREDLYHRLAVITLRLPPLREHPDDVPSLARVLLARLGLDDARIDTLLAPDVIDRLRAAPWPGNVRELRNHLERFVVLGELELPAHTAAPSGSMSDTSAIDPNVPYALARARAVAAFEQSYAVAVLALHGDNVTKAARAAGVARGYFYRLLGRTPRAT